MNSLAFKSFLASAGLSTRRFGGLCGIGKTTVHRLAQPRHGGLTESYVRRITPVIMDACRRHLEQTGAGAGAIHRCLTDIFGDDFKPMINPRVTLTPEVLEFFGLKRDPFAAPRSPAELFTTPAIESVYAELCAAVRCQGFVCLLAPVGAGKTMLKARLIAELGPGSRPSTLDLGPLTFDSQIQDPGSKIKDRSSVILSPKFFDMSRVTAPGIVAYVLEELGVKPRRALVLAQKQLERRLAELARNNITVALCFDECHRLNDTLLTALKNFYELGTGGFERYLGLILFGQPQFAARLELPRFREIAERLTCLELPAFPVETAENYLAHCLSTARHNSISDLEFGIWDFAGSPSVSAGSESPVCKVKDPNPKSEIPHPTCLFEPSAVRLIAARASTPLGIANAASAAMLEAYRMGERCILARFVAEDTGPKAMKVGK